MRVRRLGVASAFFALLLLPATVPAQSELTPPIAVDSRDDWLRLGFQGNGTKANPFLVEDLRLDAPRRAREPLLAIRDVPDHAVVRRLLVVGGEVGILVETAPNVRIENVTVRGAQIGIQASGVVLDHVSVFNARVGIAGERTHVRNSLVENNENGVSGHGLRIVNTSFVENTFAVTVEPGIPDAQVAQSYLNHSTVYASKAVGVLASSKIAVKNVTFHENVVGMEYRGAANLATAKGSNFGDHTGAAVKVSTSPAPTWKLDAKGNWWGHPSGPSPTGFGSPVEGQVDFSSPAKAVHLGARSAPAVGASFPGKEGPTTNDAGSQFMTDRHGDTILLVQYSVDDPDGIATWEIWADEVLQYRERVQDKTSDTAAFAVPNPDTNATRNVTLIVRDLYGAETRVDRLFEPTAPEPVVEDNETLPPETNDSPAVPGLLAALGVAAAAHARRRGRPPE